MSSLIAAVGPSAAWYLTRSTGTVATVLLSLSVVLGVLDVQRLHSPRWPRFVLDSLHRNVSLLVLVFLVLHIITSVLDSFAPIALVDSVAPFIGSYRPFWLGLGAVSFDLLLAVTITSLLRQRVGHRAWRVTHWLAYAAWPAALLHGLGTGSDIKSTWMLGLTAVCALAVTAAVAVRAIRGWPGDIAVRSGALAATGAFVLGLVAWLPGGPLGRGWARRSGTPVALLGAGVPSSGVGRRTPIGASTSTSLAFARPFTARFAGTLAQGPGPPGGLVAVRVAARFGAAGRLNIEIDGQPSDGGGVAMSAGRVRLGTRAAPGLYSGPVTSLAGERLAARVTRADGRGLALDIALAIDVAGQTVSGTLSGLPTTAGASP